MTAAVKSSISDLALFGAAPAFQDMLHVGRPNIGNRQLLFERFNDMLDRRWLSNSGRFEVEFEQRIADLTKVKHCIVVCNATIGLQILIAALGLRGEVIVPSFTFVATAHALLWQGITPVFADIDPDTHNLDPRDVERRITDATTGVMGVHLWGRPCAIESLSQIARARGLSLIFDAAHAFACSHGGRMIGNFGDAEVFSFHATKFLNSFEGGAVVTNNDLLAEKLRLYRNFGFAGYDDVVSVGINGKLSEPAAIMGLTSLDSLDAFIDINRRNYCEYKHHLRDIPGLSLISFEEDERNNYQYVVVEVDDTAAGLSRDELLAVLHAENIFARRYFYPGCHNMEPYRTLFPLAGSNLPSTTLATHRVVVLPTGTAMDGEAIEAVCRIIRTAVTYSSEVRARAVESQVVGR